MAVEIGVSDYPVRDRKHQGFEKPTPRQVDSLERYVNDSLIPAPVRWGIRQYLDAHKMTYAMASDILGMLKVFKESSGIRASAEGIYFNPNEEKFYLVARARSSGNLYAKELFIHSHGSRAEDGSFIRKPKMDWIYVPGAIGKIRSDWRITAEQAKAFGDIHGICIKCHTELTNPESIARGMGPICAGKI